MEGNSSWRQKGSIVTISRKAPHSAEQKRLQRGGGTGRGLEDCGKASIGVQVLQSHGVVTAFANSHIVVSPLKIHLREEFTAL